jgi:hypothetical protein
MLLNRLNDYCYCCKTTINILKCIILDGNFEQLTLFYLYFYYVRNNNFYSVWYILYEIYCFAQQNKFIVKIFLMYICNPQVLPIFNLRCNYYKPYGKEFIIIQI